MNGWRRTEAGIYAPEEIAGAWERVARNRYVAHIDMLGMSGLVVSNPRLAWSAVFEIVIARQRRVEGISYTIDRRNIRISDHVAYFNFSDTILLFTRSDDEDDLRSILFACFEMFSTLLSRSVPMRIGVAHGLFVFNQETGVFVGPPLVRAYQLGEEAQWLGAVVDPAVAERAATLQPALKDNMERDVVVRWEVPLKDGRSVLRSVLAWPRSHRANFRVDLPISVEQFYQAFVQLFGPLESLDAGVRAKYENTGTFVNAMLD